MPILYEPSELDVKQLRRKYRPKVLQSTEAPRWRVIEEYAVSSIYLTSDQLRDHIKDELAKACAKKDATLEYFEVLDAWAVWKVVYTEYHIKYKAIIKGSPISQVVVILILAICLAVLIIFAIWLVKRYVLDPIFEAIPPELRGPVITAVVVGGAILLIGGGIYLATRWMKRK